MCLGCILPFSEYFRHVTKTATGTTVADDTAADITAAGDTTADQTAADDNTDAVYQVK